MKSSEKRSRLLTSEAHGASFGISTTMSSRRSSYDGCEVEEVTREVSTVDVRQRLGDILNRVALQHDEYVIVRRGKPLAALVPVAKLEQMRRIARRHALGFMGQQRGGPLSEDDATRLALEARRWTRRAVRENRRGPWRTTITD